MTEFEKDYSELVEIAQKLISKHRSTLSEYDIVNEAYIIATQKGGYNRKTFVGLMHSVLYLEKEHSLKFVDINSAYYNNQTKEVSFVCRSCKLDKPICEAITVNGNIVGAICKECRHEYDKKYQPQYYNKKKCDEAFKRVRAKACRKYQSKADNKKRHNEQQKAYQEEQKENLTDVYIRHLFRTLSKPIKTTDITPEMIIAKRNELLEKRKRNDV